MVQDIAKVNEKYLAKFDLLKAVISTDSTIITSGAVFAFSSSNGDIQKRTPQGFYAYDTRFLSEFTISLNGHKLLKNGSATFDDALASFYCNYRGYSLVRDRYVSHGLHEDISIINHSPTSKKLRIELTFDADFADIFEVRRGKIQKVGDIRIEPREGQHLALVYRRGNFSRETWIRFSTNPEIRGNSAIFEVVLESKMTWKTCVDVAPVLDHKSEPTRCNSLIQGSPFEDYAGKKVFLGFFRQVNSGAPLERVPELKTDNADLNQAYCRAIADLRSLRLEKDGKYLLAAGLPWFMAIFGRDAIISALQTKLLGPELMTGTLQTLAELQATTTDPFREAEPGKILHEARRGELSYFENVPHSRYYGSVDSTPLFLSLLWEAYQWTGDISIIKRFLPVAERALSWIERYGDRDGDGFVEYQRRTRKGLRNQGWKDSWDSISFADGTLATPPIALAEVQGYVYDAKKKMAEIFGLLGNFDAEGRLKEEAEKLKERFNQAFWMPEAGYYAIALDSRKRQVDSIASNPGHCLWSGIVDEDKAPKVAERLMSPDMFTGWGIRTLSAGMTRYNPLSYHNGTVWPHDNSIIAAGLARYGFTKESNRVAMALLDAASVFQSYRLPELFAGYPRREYSFPVPYPAANAPQAWASGALIYLMETVLGVTCLEDGLLTSTNGRKPPFSLIGVRYRGKEWDLP